MKVWTTNALTFEEFVELRKWCDEYSVAYRNTVFRSRENYVDLYIHDSELEIFAKLKWGSKLTDPESDYGGITWIHQ